MEVVLNISVIFVGDKGSATAPVFFACIHN